MTIARTHRVILRQFRASDCEAMHSVFGDAEVMRFSEGTRTLADVRRWVDQWIDERYRRWGFGMWAVVREHDGLTIGYCGLSRFPDRVEPGETEIGFRLARPFWGHGFATEAVRATRDYAVATLKLPKLVALIDPANVASIRVVQKSGFDYERDALLEGYDHPDRVYSFTPPAGG